MLKNNILKIATRKSRLALWQAKYVKKNLITYYPNLNIQLVPIITKGDVMLNTSLYKIGGKGLFIKALEEALLKKKADIAVHSIKDIPSILPKKLGLVTVCKRENPLDAFISNQYNSFKFLPKNAIVGTSSLRRISQIYAIRPDINIRNLRGNIDTRIKKLDLNQYDAIILAVAGLKRINLQNRIKSIISPEKILPAGGQGAIGIECHLDNYHIINMLSVLHHNKTFIEITAERAMIKRIQGGCHLPSGTYAIFNKNKIWIRGFIGSPDGKNIIRDECHGSSMNAKKLGILLAEKLLNKSKKIL